MTTNEHTYCANISPASPTFNNSSIQSLQSSSDPGGGAVSSDNVLQFEFVSEEFPVVFSDNDNNRVSLSGLNFSEVDIRDPGGINCWEVASDPPSAAFEFELLLDGSNEITTNNLGTDEVLPISNLPGFEMNTVEIPLSGCDTHECQGGSVPGNANSDSMLYYGQVNALPPETKCADVSVSENSKRLSKRGSPKYSRPRRRDYIENVVQRGKHFEFYRAISRTGCSGNLSANYDGKLFKVDPPNDTGSAPHSSVLSSSSVTCNQVDDHPYAATILTQNVSSSTVRDHQYDEITTVPDHEWDDFEEDAGQKKRSQRGTFNYIKSSWEREQIFCKLAKSMFWQKIRLTQRTGATINLKLKYERFIVDDSNYEDAYKLFRLSKNLKGIKTLPIAPKPKLNSEESSRKCSHSLIAAPMGLVSPITGVIETQKLQNVTSEAPPDPQCNNRNDLIYRIQSCNSLQLDQSAVVGSHQETEEVSTTFTTCEARDNFTSTKAFCRICHEWGDSTSNSRKQFWIRCNDPFCYDMIHAKCLGFMVTSAADLKRLPPFYCKQHILDN